jgi:hypothetical protein
MPYQHGLDRQGEIGTYLEGPLKGQTPVAVLISAKETAWLKIVGRDVAKLDAAKGAPIDATSEPISGTARTGVNELTDASVVLGRIGQRYWQVVH